MKTTKILRACLESRDLSEKANNRDKICEGVKRILDMFNKQLHKFYPVRRFCSKSIDFKQALTIIALLSLVGCATTNSNGIDAFKGQTAKQIYVGGQQAVKKGKWNIAVKNFEALDAIYPFGKYAEKGQRELIYSYYKNSDSTSAVAAADRYIHLYPRGKSVDFAYYMQGMAYFNQTKTLLGKLYHRDLAARDLAPLQASFIAFSNLLRQYPKSKYASRARQKMVLIRNTIAKHELEIANFYYVRKAYVAAANRASYIVDHLEGTPQVKQALLIMYRSYRAIGADAQAANTLKVIRLNYPKLASRLS